MDWNAQTKYKMDKNIKEKGQNQYQMDRNVEECLESISNGSER